METTFKGLISMIYSVWRHLYCKLENYLTSLHCMKVTPSDSEAVHVQKGALAL